MACRNSTVSSDSHLETGHRWSDLHYLDCFRYSLFFSTGYFHFLRPVLRTVADYVMGKQWLTLFLGDSKITADGDYRHEIKRCLLLGRKVMTNLDSIFKSRDITLPTKVCLVEAMVFPVVMYGCESWTVKKAEHRRIDAFELWC